MEKILIILSLVFILLSYWEVNKIETTNNNEKEVIKETKISKNNNIKKEKWLSTKIKKEIFKKLVEAEKKSKIEADKIVDITKIWLNKNDIKKHNIIRIENENKNKKAIYEKYKITEEGAGNIVWEWLVNWWEM